jgi:hypothetical protein
MSFESINHDRKRKGGIMESYLTESEALRIAEALQRGELESADNRSDGERDADPLQDPNRIGARIAAGFALLNSCEK